MWALYLVVGFFILSLVPDAYHQGNPKLLVSSIIGGLVMIGLGIYRASEDR